MIIGLIIWALNFIFSICLTYVIWQMLKLRRSSLNLAAFIFLWILTITALLFFMGSLGGLTPGWLLLVSASGLALLFAIPSTRKPLLHFLQGFGELKHSIQAWWSTLPRWIRPLTLALLVFGVVRFAFLIWVLPPFVWDSLSYHLTNVGQWIQDGRIGLFDSPIERIFSAANYEVLATWFGVFIHHDIVIEASGLPAYLLGGASMYALARGLGQREGTSLLATIAFLTTPAFLFAVTNTKNDPFVAAYFLFACALIVEVFRADQEPAGDDTLGLLVLLVMSLAVAVGTKAYIAHLLPGIVLLVILLALADRGKSILRRRLSDLFGSLRGLSRGKLFTILGLVIIALILGGYWYIRNWVVIGSPFYPYPVEIEGTTLRVEGGSFFNLSVDNLLYSLRSLGEKFGDKQYRIVPDLPNTTGWGWVIYGMGLPAAVWAFWKDKRFRYLSLAFLVSLLALSTSLPRSPWTSRYIIWFPAIFALGIGAFFEQESSWSTVQRKAFSGLILLGTLMNSLMSLNYNLIPFTEIDRMLSTPALGRHAGLLQLQAPEEYRFVYETVPEDEILGYNIYSNGFVYPLYRADLSQRLVFIPVAQDADCGAIARLMTDRGTRYLFVAPVHTQDEVIAKLEACAVQGDVLRERGPGLFVIADE